MIWGAMKTELSYDTTTRRHKVIILIDDIDLYNLSKDSHVILRNLGG